MLLPDYLQMYLEIGTPALNNVGTSRVTKHEKAGNYCTEKAGSVFGIEQGSLKI